MGKKIIKASRGDYLLLGACAVLSLAIQAISLGSPYRGFHVFRQLQTLYAIEDYVRNGIDVLNLRFADVGHLEPIARILEFPLFQLCAALAADVTGETLVTARVVNLAFSTASVLLVFLIGTLWAERGVGLYGAVLFAFAPISLLYHSSLLVDVVAVLTCLIAFYCLLLILQRGGSAGRYAVLAVAGAFCVLVKGLYAVPLVVMVLLRLVNDFREGGIAAAWKRRWPLLALFALWGAGLLAWIGASEHYSGGGILAHLGWTALLEPVFYVRLAYRLLFLVLNPLAAFLAMVAVICCYRREGGDFLRPLAAIVAAYYLLFPSINNPHDYYSLAITPYLCLLAGAGAVQVERGLSSCGASLGGAVGGLRAVICVLASAASVLILFTSVASGIVSFNYFEHERAEVDNAPLRDTLVEYQFAKVYVAKTVANPLAYVRNRTDILKLYYGVGGSEVPFRAAGPLFDNNALLYSIRQRGHIEFTDGSAPPFAQARERERFKGRLRYLLYYRYGAGARQQIAAMLQPRRPLYADDNWLAFDLTDPR